MLYLNGLSISCGQSDISRVVSRHTEKVQLIITLIGLLFLSEPSRFNTCLIETAALQYPSGTISRMTFGR